MSSFYEIGGIILRGDLNDIEPQTFPSLQLGDLAAERLERRRNSAKDESVTSRRFAATDTGERRPGIVGHYFRTLWWAGTEPTRRVLEDPMILIPVRKNPRALVGVYLDIVIENLEMQHEYFSGGNPWD